MKREELAEYSATTGFNIWQLEKDYLQHLFLLFLSIKSKNELIFKGGTALQKVYGSNRFSIDLDFTEVKETKNLIQNISKSFTDFGYSSAIKKINEDSSLVFKLISRGPLYKGSERSLSVLKIEISRREKVLLNPKLVEIVPVYRNVAPYITLVMDEKEILAEKIRTILTRNKARDIYDLWFLFRKGIKMDEDIVNKKLEISKIKYYRKEFLLKIKERKNIWDKELSLLVHSVPDFSLVFSEIKEYL